MFYFSILLVPGDNEAGASTSMTLQLGGLAVLCSYPTLPLLSMALHSPMNQHSLSLPSVSKPFSLSEITKKKEEREKGMEMGSVHWYLQWIKKHNLLLGFAFKRIVKIFALAPFNTRALYNWKRKGWKGPEDMDPMGPAEFLHENGHQINILSM